jgi:hypothetical protein
MSVMNGIERAAEDADLFHCFVIPSAVEESLAFSVG